MAKDAELPSTRAHADALGDGDIEIAKELVLLPLADSQCKGVSDALAELDSQSRGDADALADALSLSNAAPPFCGTGMQKSVRQRILTGAPASPLLTAESAQSNHVGSSNATSGDPSEPSEPVPCIPRYGPGRGGSTWKE